MYCKNNPNLLLSIIFELYLKNEKKVMIPVMAVIKQKSVQPIINTSFLNMLNVKNNSRQE